MPLGEADLRRAITEFDQGLDNALIVANDALVGTGRVVRRGPLGGLLGFYQPEAA